MSPIQFVSLGPGEAELITLKGLKALQNADCIFCPETPVRDGHSLSRAADIMLRLDIPANRIRRFSLPMSKQRTDALNAYDQVYAAALSLHHAGKKVAIVAEGDAGFYSSVHYIYEKHRQPGREADRNSRHHHRRRDRTADTIAEHGSHHETVAVHR